MGVLADAYSEVFATVLAFRAASEDERPGYGSFRANVMSVMGDAKRRVDDDDLDRRGYAEYAVVALIDESVMNSDWAGAEQWSREPLQQHYFGSLLAGEQFFDRLDELRADHDEELLEIYFYCLCAGFRGRFYDDAGELHRRRAKLHKQLRHDVRDDKHLTEQAYARPLERSITRSYFPFWWVAPFLVGAVALYFGYYAALSDQVNQIVSTASGG